MKESMYVPYRFINFIEIQRSIRKGVNHLSPSLSTCFYKRKCFSFSLSCRTVTLLQPKRWGTASSLDFCKMSTGVKMKERSKEGLRDHPISSPSTHQKGDAEWTGTYDPIVWQLKKKKKEEGRLSTKEKRDLRKEDEKEDEEWKTERRVVDYAGMGTEELLETAGIRSPLCRYGQLSHELKRKRDRAGRQYPCEEDEDNDTLHAREEDEEDDGSNVNYGGMREGEDLPELNFMDNESEMEEMEEEKMKNDMQRGTGSRSGKKKRKKKRRIKKNKEREALMQMIKREAPTNESEEDKRVTGRRDNTDGEESVNGPRRRSEEEGEEAARLQQHIREGSKALIHHYPLMAREYDLQANQNDGKMTPLESLSIHSSSVVHWKCLNCQHSWTAAVFIRAILKAGCPQCESKARPTVAQYKPEMLSCWSKEHNDPFLSLHTLTVDSRKSIFWRCPNCEHIYSARVRDQVHGQKVFCTSCGKTIFGEFPQRRKGKNRLKKPKIFLRRVLAESDPIAEARIAAAVKKAYAIRKALKEKASLIQETERREDESTDQRNGTNKVKM